MKRLFGDAVVLLRCEAWKEGQTDDEKQASCLDLRPIKNQVLMFAVHCISRPSEALYYGGSPCSGR